MAQHFLDIVADLRPQKVVQAVADAALSVPAQGLQRLPDGVVAVLVGDDGEGRAQLFLVAQLIISLAIPKQILHIGVGERRSLPLPADVPDDVDPVGEEIQANVPAQLRVLGQNGTIVLDDLPRLPLAVGNEPPPHALEDGVLDSLRVEALIVEPLRHQHGRRDGGVDGGRKFF